jgi:hypothetical protein
MPRARGRIRGEDWGCLRHWLFRYSVAKLIEKHGRKGNLMVWREMLNGDCPKRDARLHDRCDLVCPDLPNNLSKVTACSAVTEDVDGD